MSVPPIVFATTNPEKFTIAQFLCTKAGVPIKQVKLDVDEIQSEDGDAIAIAKAIASYKVYGKPLVISDDTWEIPALGGFPGPYMKSMNHWFSTKDFLRLLGGITDRTILLHQRLVYIDESGHKLFTASKHGTVLTETRTPNARAPWMSIASMEGDNGLTIAEVFANGKEVDERRLENRPHAWRELITWYLETHA